MYSHSYTNIVVVVFQWPKLIGLEAPINLYSILGLTHNGKFGKKLGCLLMIL